MPCAGSRGKRQPVIPADATCDKRLQRPASAVGNLYGRLLDDVTVGGTRAEEATPSLPATTVAGVATTDSTSDAV